jgi:hypothetical protein
VIIPPPIWLAEVNSPSGHIRKVHILRQGQQTSYTDWIQAMQSSSNFIHFFNAILADIEFEGFYWEVPPVRRNQLHRPFEFVLVESRGLPVVNPDSVAFREFFEPEAPVVSFPNLGRDAQLVVPTPIGETINYGHLGAFVRGAPQDQILAFWKRVAFEYEHALYNKPRWLSTAGHGVHWLHVRIDSRPKYYRHNPYRTIMRYHE